MKIHIVIQQYTCCLYHMVLCYLSHSEKGGRECLVCSPCCLSCFFHLSSHHSHIFGRMSFLTAVPCASFVLQPLHPWMPHMCIYTGLCPFGGHTAHIYTCIYKMIILCVWLSHQSVKKYDILVHFSLGPKQTNIYYTLSNTLTKFYFASLGQTSGVLCWVTYC